MDVRCLNGAPGGKTLGRSSETFQLVCPYMFLLTPRQTQVCPTNLLFFAGDDVMSGKADLFLEFLIENDLCLPCATDLPRGPRETWTAVDGQSHHCNDCVVIPQAEISFCTRSYVMEDFEPGNSFDDHQVVEVQIQWMQK